MRRLLMFVCLIGLQFGLISTSNAGGWATTPITKLPDTIVAGQAFQLEFSVLQHGNKPTNGIGDQLVQPLLTGESMQRAESFSKFGHNKLAMLAILKPRCNFQLPGNGKFRLSQCRLAPSRGKSIGSPCKQQRLQKQPIGGIWGSQQVA